MYEMRKLGTWLANAPLSLEQLREWFALQTETELSDLTSVPTEYAELEDVAHVLAAPSDMKSRETVVAELCAALLHSIDAEGIARRGNYVIRPLTDRHPR